MAETLNFTQFCTKYGFTCDYDITDHASLSPSGHMSKRGRKFLLNALTERLASNKEGHLAYRQAIMNNKVIDPSGNITKEKMILEDTQDNAEKTTSSLYMISGKIAFIDSLGSMSHKKNGSLKKGYQCQVDELVKERELLILTN